MSEFVVRPFAFMRLTHEALRAGFSKIGEAVEAGDVDEARRELGSLQGVMTLHARQEEEVFFPMLDRLFDGAVHKAGLREAHHREDGHEKAFEMAVEAGYPAKMRSALEAWRPSFERHLAEEEEVMMPLTSRVADTLAGRAAAVRQIIEVDWDHLRALHLPYVVGSLNDTKPYGPLRMFVASLQLAAGERYGELEDIVRSSVSPEKAQMLQQHGHLS